MAGNSDPKRVVVKVATTDYYLVGLTAMMKAVYSVEMMALMKADYSVEMMEHSQAETKVD